MKFSRRWFCELFFRDSSQPRNMNRFNHHSPFFLLFLLSFLAVPFIKIPVEAQTPPLWGRWEQSFVADNDAEPDPATGLIVRLLAPSGKRRVISAFWDGGRVWRVRFMPDEPGRWRYRTTAFPNYPGLNEQVGEFICRRAPSRNRFSQHGAIRVAAAGTYLEHHDRTPFFWLGDTAWNGALLASQEDWRTYLDDRAAKNFTAIQFVMTAPWRTAPTNAEGKTAFTGRERITINPQFFKRIDERIEAINARGLLAAPVLIWSNHRDDPGRSLPEDQIVRLAKYMVARYAAHHVVWILAGDDKYEGANAERWQRIGRAVFAEAKQAPVVMHPQGRQWPFEVFQKESWVSLIGYQSGHGDDNQTLAWIHSGPPAREWRRQPVRPIINLEPPYEDHVAYQSRQQHTAYTVRRAAYWSLLASPMAGLTYGAHGIWSWQLSPDEPLNHQGTGVAKAWREALALPGSAQMKHLAEFFGALPWSRLRPDQTLLAAQPGANEPTRFVSVARTSDGKVAVIYLPAGGEIALKERAPKGKRTEWFNPRTGERTRAGTEDGFRFRAPDAEDWLLILR